MKKLILSVIYLFLCLLTPKAQAFSFSDSTKVSLITCSPGKEVYARFGHTAVRVNDPINGIDIVFNYGIFDFNSKNFYLKFIKGETDYKLAAYDFIYFLSEYIERNSWVWEQVLNLNPAEKKKLINSLMLNHRPENRTYRYNFVFDNCSTRPREKIIESLDGRLNYPFRESEKTFRDWVGLYTGEDTWLKFGIDMIFGDDADKLATRSQSMFLPEILMGEFQTAEITSIENEERRSLVSEYAILAEKKSEQKEELFFLFTPFAVSMFLLALGFAFLYKNRRFHYFYKTFDTVLFVTIGLIGCIVAYLSFFSLHPLVKHNASILWLNPLFLFAGVAQWIRPLKTATFFIILLNNLLILVILLLYAFDVHYFNAAFIPLITLLFLRSLNYNKIRLRKGIKIGNRKIKYSQNKWK